jgi:hypothetical protein
MVYALSAACSTARSNGDLPGRPRLRSLRGTTRPTTVPSPAGFFGAWRRWKAPRMPK